MMSNKPPYLDGLKQAQERVTKLQEQANKEGKPITCWSTLLFKPVSKDAEVKVISKDTPVDDISRLRQHWSG